MASVYILHSESLGQFYTGSCKEFTFRLEQHLTKEFKGAFTTRADDWVLFYIIEELEYRQARLIESHIKKQNSSIYIRNLKKYPEITERLKQKYRKAQI